MLKSIMPGFLYLLSWVSTLVHICLGTLALGVYDSRLFMFEEFFFLSLWYLTWGRQIMLFYDVM